MAHGRHIKGKGVAGRLPERLPERRRRIGTFMEDCYMESMAKAGPIMTERVVRDAKSGRLVTVRGAGALKGRLSIREDVDLTKPIAAQVLKGSSGRKGGSAQAKR